MKKVLVYSVIFLVAYVFSQFVFADYVQAENGALNIDEIIRNINPKKFTKAQIKEYTKKVQDKQARGKGIVVDVIGGKKDKHKVTILTQASKPDKGYNVVLYTTQKGTSSLRKNNSISFKGEVGRISTFRGASVDIHGTYKKE